MTGIPEQISIALKKRELDICPECKVRRTHSVKRGREQIADVYRCDGCEIVSIIPRKPKRKTPSLEDIWGE